MSLSAGSSTANDVAVERLLASLAEQAQDVQESLEHFGACREEVLLNQKRALAEYEAEMFFIENEGQEEQDEGAEQYRYMDPNVMKHLNVDRDSDYTKNVMRALMPDADKKTAHAHPSISEYPIVKKDLEVDTRAAPTFNEKKKLRETMFLVLEESSIEETRIELAYEEARDCGDYKKAAELADALYFLQRMNTDRLNDIIGEYRPEPFSRSWGTDPEYAALTKQIAAMTESLETADLMGALDVGPAGSNTEKKTKKKKKVKKAT